MDNFTWFDRETHPFDEDARIHLIYVYIYEYSKENNFIDDIPFNSSKDK